MNEEIKGPPQSVQAEQSIIGALLRDNDAVDRIADLQAEHFYSNDHALIFKEIVRQISAGRRADVITVMQALEGKMRDVGRYLNDMAQTTPSSANIRRYVDIVIDRSMKRALLAIGGDLQQWATSPEDAGEIADRAAARIESAARREVGSDPVLMCDLLTEHVELMQARVEGAIKPVSTGYPGLDRKLGGGMARGTLIVVAGRPAMGKTAFGLSVARNVSENGVSAFWSMEMPRKQVMDRNISAIGRLPLEWVMAPTEEDSGRWANLTHAYQRARDMRMFIDEQTSMNMLQIRAKARMVKRKAGQLDLLVIDQLSFITGAESENYAYALGEYTRGLVGLAKELDIPVLLLCQLSRKCDDRPNKRPVLSDLASSGNIEQDAATAIFLYRDEVYNPDSPDKGIAEIIIGKARQGETGMVGLAYIGEQTRFESLARPFTPQPAQQKGRSMADRL